MKSTRKASGICGQRVLLKWLMALAISAATLAPVHVTATSVDYDNPVRSAQEDEVKSLANYTLESRLFAGYLKAFDDGEEAQWLYYWLVESTSDPANDPIVLFHNGGPGGTPLSMAVHQLNIPADYRWNRYANMLYIDGPVGVGFSYAKNQPQVITDDSTARANYLALKSFMQKFPHYAKNPLYLTGVSYAGVFMPTLGVLVDEDPQLNLKGIAIRNGLFNGRTQFVSAILFAHYHGLIGEELLDELSVSCCEGKPPTREACVRDDPLSNRSCRETLSHSRSRLNHGWFNPGNVYERAKNRLGQIELETSRSAGDNISYSLSIDKNLCRYRGADFVDKLGDSSTRGAIHVPTEFNRAWTIYYCKQYDKRPGGLSKQIKKLIDSKRNLTMLAYNGDVDLVCDFIGTKWFVEDLGKPALTAYMPWYFNDQGAGLIQHFEGITYATIHGAGHGPDAFDKEIEIIRRFLNSTSRNVYLLVK